MKVYRYEDSLAELTASPVPTVFLAGPTVRGNQPHLTSWRFEAIAEFERQGFTGDLVVPEFSKKEESDKGKEWIPAWEFTGLSGCDVIMFWVPRTRELIGLTTNHEHGYWLARDVKKCVYGRPDDSYRNRYLDLMWEFHAKDHGLIHMPIWQTLESTISCAILHTTRWPGDGRVLSNIPVESPYGKF